MYSLSGHANEQCYVTFRCSFASSIATLSQMDPQSIPAFTNGRDIVQAKLQHRRTNVEAGRGNYDASGGRRLLVAAVTIRRDVISLHVPDEVVFARDEIRGERGQKGRLSSADTASSRNNTGRPNNETNKSKH